MSTTANWVGLGTHAAGFVATALFLRPMRAVATTFESDLGWGLILFGFLASVVRFVAEALKFGRWPEAPALYATNWIRHVGAGLGAVGFIGSYLALCKGGVFQFAITTIGVASYYTLFTFAALAFETTNAVIGFFTIGAFIFVVLVAMMLMHGRSSVVWFISVIGPLIEIAFITMTGIEVFKRSIASEATEDWIFMAISVSQAVWAVLVYLGSDTKPWVLYRFSMEDDLGLGGTTYTQVQQTDVKYSSKSAVLAGY